MQKSPKFRGANDPAETKYKVWNWPTSFDENVMGIFSFEIFLLQIPFKRSCRYAVTIINYCGVIVRVFFKADFRGVNEPGEKVSAGSQTPRKFFYDFSANTKQYAKRLWSMNQGLKWV
jgi:hypothetical protein